MSKIYGVTGSIGCGKSHTCKQLNELAQLNSISCNYINTDVIGRDIIGLDSKYQHVRDLFKKEFGSQIMQDDGSINKGKLAQYLVRSHDDLAKINSILLPYSVDEIQRRIDDETNDLTLVESALFAEHGLQHLVDYNMVLVTANNEVQKQRVESRKCPYKNGMKRLEYQLSQEEKRNTLLKEQMENGSGLLVSFDTSHNPSLIEYEKLLERLI